MSTSSAFQSSVGYGPLLRQNGNFRTLWTAQLISAAGDWFNSVAVLGLVLQLTNSGLSASLVLLSNNLPAFFLIPVAGPIVDRFDRRTLMIASNLFSAVFALLYLLIRDGSLVWLAYVSNALLVTSASFFLPASSASIPNIVSDAELFSANALTGSTWGIMVMVGSALGGIVSTLFGRDTAFVINAISFLVAAGLIATLTIPSPKKHGKGNQRGFVEGVRYLGAYRPALSLVAVKTLWGLAGGVLVLLSVFGTQVFKAGDTGIGLLYSARGFGALIGPFVVRGFAGRSVGRLRTAMWIGFLMSGIGYMVFAGSGLLGALWLAMIALVFAHFGGGTEWALSNMLLQVTTPDRLRGRVLAVDNGLTTLTTSLSMLIFGLALQAGLSPSLLAFIGGLIFAGMGILWAVLTSYGPQQITEATLAEAPGANS